MAHLKSILDRQLALGSSLVDNFDFSDSVDLNFISSVRHPERDVENGVTELFQTSLSNTNTYF